VLAGKKYGHILITKHAALLADWKVTHDS